MSQDYSDLPINVGEGDPTPGAVSLNLNENFDAILSQHLAGSSPTYKVEGQMWIKDVSATVWEVYLYDGANDIMLYKVNPTTHVISDIMDYAGFTAESTAVDSDIAIMQKIAGTRFKITFANIFAYIKSKIAATTLPILAATLKTEAVQAGQIQKNTFSYYTSGGSSTVYTLTTLGSPIDLTTGECFTVRFHTTAGATPTLNRDSKGAKSLKYYNSSGVKTDCSASIIYTNMISRVIYDGTDYVVLDTVQASSSQVMVLHDLKATTVDGGTFTSGAWQDRTLHDTPQYNGISGASCSSNVITLPTGTYEIEAICPAYWVHSHQARLYNETDGAVAVLGTSASTSTNTTPVTNSFVKGVFTIAAEKTFKIQHQCENTKGTDGFGISNDFGLNEIYTVAKFTKIA